MKYLVGFVFCLLLWFGLARISTTIVRAVTPTPAPSNNTGHPTGARDPEEYNYLPLILRPNISLDNTGTLQDTLIANLVLDQGYEVHCAAPAWHMHPTLYGEIKKYFESANYKGPVTLKAFDDPYIVNMSESRVAMMRGDERLVNSTKISSLEALFGVVNPDLPPNELNSSGAVNKLTGFEQQCNIKYDTMTEIWNVCLKLQNKENCFLNSVIPNTGGLKMVNLMGTMQEARAKYNDNDNFCRDFVKEYEPEIHERMGLSASSLEKWNNALQNYSIDQPFLYRVGFLVVSIKQNEDTDDEGTNDVFWFRKQPEDINLPLEAPIVVAFKIPDFATNKSNLMAKYKDSSKIIRNLFWKPEVIEEMEKAAQEKRGQNMNAISKKRAEADIIKYCALYPCRSGEEEILQRAVIDIINGIGTHCGEDYMPIEQAGDIGSPGNLNAENGRRPLPEHFSAMIDSTRQFRFNWELYVDEPNPPVSGESMTMMAHLVIPWGTDLGYVEDTLKALFNPNVYQKMEETNVMVDYDNKIGVAEYYPIRNAMTTFQGTDPSHKYQDYTQPPECKFDKFGVWKCEYPTKEFQASVIETGKQEFRILGARLGWMIKKIQELARQPHLQIKCSRTEDLFLGRCEIQPLGEETASKCTGEEFKKIKGLPSSSGIPEEAQAIFRGEIEPKITQDMIEAFEYAEEQTGIPCEVIAGIHWTEAGSDPNKSVFDGGALRGSLKEDATAAMQHLISFWPGGFNKGNITYEDLTTAIGAYNGPGNLNCSYNIFNEQRQTRWRNGGRCEAQFPGEDHPHPLGWIDERHSNMDLVYCLDFVEFSCNVDPNATELEELKTKLENLESASNLTPEAIDALVTRAGQFCYSTSSICQSLADGNKYPRYERPGSITTAILLNEAGTAQ